MKRVAILYSRLSGYSAACQRALKDLYGAELLVVHWPVDGEAPFSDDIYGHIDHCYDRNEYDAAGIIRLLEEFQPDVLLISGWMDRAYLKAGRVMRKKGITVIAGSDTQWSGSWRQKAAQWIAPFYLYPTINVLWVTGERQRQLAWRIGYRGDRCWDGFYTCDWPKFAGGPVLPKEKAFLYTGRYVERKGLRSLLEAYARYRRESSDPWSLWTAGTGPLAAEVENSHGVQNYGFVQPDQLPQLMRRASAFVLPSLYEPWGVALHEATASALPVLASRACGASVHLLRDGFNGFSFEGGDSRHLAELLHRLSGLSEAEQHLYGERSYQLSQQFQPQLWADTLIQNMGWRES